MKILLENRNLNPKLSIILKDNGKGITTTKDLKSVENEINLSAGKGIKTMVDVFKHYGEIHLDSIMHGLGWRITFKEDLLFNKRCSL